MASLSLRTHRTSSQPPASRTDLKATLREVNLSYALDSGNPEPYTGIPVIPEVYTGNPEIPTDILVLARLQIRMQHTSMRV